jgi:hypothetical protein
MDAKIQKIVSSMIVLTLCFSFLSSVLTPRIVKADPGWDFVIDTLTSDKLSYNWGEQAQIWVGITNTGTQKIGNNLARADFEVISPQGQTVFTGQDWLGYDINPGAGWVFDTWWTIPTNMATGYYSIKVTITVWETSYQSPTHVKTKEVDNYFLVAGSSSPTPSVSPTSLDFGTSDTQKSFSITNTGGGTLTWSLSSSQSWLSVTPSSGSGNAGITVNVNRSGLSSGSYNGVITVNSNNGILAVSVTMQIPVLTQSWDFVIGTLTSDKLSYNWGEQAQIWAAITNTGSEKISNNYARADFEIISPQGQTVFTGQDWLGYDINPGAGWILDTHWTIPSDAAIGSYSIRVTVTIWEGINGQWQGATHVKTKEVDNSFSVAGSSSPTPSVSPTSLDFGTSDTQKSFSITNTGGGTLTWSLSSSQSWLSVTPSSGSGNANIAVNVNRSGLSSGSYNGVITVNSNNGILAVSVTMQIPVLTQDPVLSVSPTSLDFGTSDTQKSFNIVNAGGGTLTWSLSSNQAWLVPGLTSGSGGATIGVTVNRNGLNSGTYSGVITVTSNGGSSTVSISMTVLAAPANPDLAVTITSIDSLVIGQQPSITAKIENKGSACIPAKRHIVSVYLIDYKGKDPSSFRAGDSYRASKDGRWSRCIYSQAIDLLELCPGDSKEVEFKIPYLAFDGNNPTLWADTLSLEIEQEPPEIYEDANLSDNIDEESVKVSPSLDSGISCVIYASLPVMVETCGLEGGVELNGDAGTALDVVSYVGNVLQQNNPAAADNLLDIAIAVAHAAVKDPFTFALGFARGLWKGALSCASLMTIVNQFITACIRADIHILSAWVSCPVDILIVDEQGNRAGYLDGTIYEEIKGSEVVVVDDQKLVLIPWDSSYTVMLSGTDVGTMDFEMILPGAENTAKIVEYQDVPVSPTTEATIDVNSGNQDYVMMTDNNGDGQIDEERSPNLANSVPNVPSNPSPANNAPAIPVSTGLNWSAGDIDAGDVVTYDVYFGTSETMPLVSSNQSATTYDRGTLAYNTTYYWQIVATDDHGASTRGPLWDFTTAHQEVPGTPIWLWLIIAAGIASLVAIIVRVVRRKAKAQPPK